MWKRICTGNVCGLSLGGHTLLVGNAFWRENVHQNGFWRPIPVMKGCQSQGGYNYWEGWRTQEGVKAYETTSSVSGKNKAICQFMLSPRTEFICRLSVSVEICVR